MLKSQACESYHQHFGVVTQYCWYYSRECYKAVWTSSSVITTWEPFISSERIVFEKEVPVSGFWIRTVFYYKLGYCYYFSSNIGIGTEMGGWACNILLCISISETPIYRYRNIERIFLPSAECTKFCAGVVWSAFCSCFLCMKVFCCWTYSL